MTDRNATWAERGFAPGKLPRDADGRLILDGKMPKPKIDRVLVDRTELEAFKEGAATAEGLRLEAMHAKEHYAQCLAVNREQMYRLQAQDLQIKDYLHKIDTSAREISRLNGEIDAAKIVVEKLQAEVAALRPAKLDVGPQPAFARRGA